MKTLQSLLVAFLAGVMLSGCGSEPACEPAPPVPTESPVPESGDPVVPTGEAEPVDEEAAATDAADVSVRVIDEQEFEAVVASYQGDVVLVDFWATWCVACVDLFPHTVELHQRLAEQGLRVISVSFDEPDMEENVLRFLQEQGATFDNFISQYGSGIESADNFDLPGPLPYIVLYDRAGEVAHTFPEPRSAVDPEAIDQAVEALLATEL